MKTQSKTCRIVSVGKRRDGGTRYWCLHHRADATAKYGRQAEKCRYADEVRVLPGEMLELEPAQYAGGVALWGAVPPIYDTTSFPFDRGVHVHARSVVGGNKVIDRTFRAVNLVDDSDGLRSTYPVSELDAIYYMTSSVFGKAMKHVACGLCGHPHLDKDWFSLHPHRRHLCAGCGRQFRDSEIGIGNPLVRLREVFGATCHTVERAKRKLRIDQSQYPGGIQIWGSNPAFLWTAPSRCEEQGIHVHIVSADGSRVEVDETYSRLEIDGETIDADMARVLMAQRALPHIAGRVTDVRCPGCGEGHLDRGDSAFTPHDTHVCEFCGREFRSTGRRRKTIGNPLLGVLSRLGSTAPRKPQIPPTYLLPETL